MEDRYDCDHGISTSEAIRCLVTKKEILNSIGLQNDHNVARSNAVPLCTCLSADSTLSTSSKLHLHLHIIYKKQGAANHSDRVSLISVADTMVEPRLLIAEALVHIKYSMG